MNPYSKFFAGELSVEAEAEFKKMMIMEELLSLMEDSGISRSELAKRMGVGPSRVTSMLSGSNNFTMETLVRAGRAVGAEFIPHFAPKGHQIHFSTCAVDEVHEAFVTTRPVEFAKTGFSIEISSADDDAAAA